MDPTSSKTDNDHDDRASDDESFSGSESSTVVYSHEPYETYQIRVRELLSTLYGSEAAQAAELTCLKGGSYNRIISVVIATKPSTQEELILRVPRFDTDIVRQVRLLGGLKPLLPVPEVVCYDASEANALDNPYVLMRRLPGQPLNDVIQDLNFEERCGMARQIAQLLAKIHRIHVPSSIGPLTIDETGTLSVDRLQEGPSFCGELENKTFDKEEQSLDQTPMSATLRKFASSRLAGHRAYALREENINYFAMVESDWLLHVSDILLSALPESDSDHCLTLFHRDFAAHNILVARSTADGQGGWTVTGILDWDDCEAAPLAIARVWPGWLWATADEDEADFDLNEWDPDLPVPNEECERIKSTFVEEIEKLEPGYLNMVRTTRDYCLRPLYER